MWIVCVCVCYRGIRENASKTRTWLRNHTAQRHNSFDCCLAYCYQFHHSLKWFAFSSSSNSGNLSSKCLMFSENTRICLHDSWIFPSTNAHTHFMSSIAFDSICIEQWNQFKCLNLSFKFPAKVDIIANTCMNKCEYA